MNIVYLLEAADLWGGVRVVFDQARALQKRGHRVTIRARGGDHRWYPYPIGIVYVADLAEGVNTEVTKPDVVIATFWTTVEAALRLDGRLIFHLCQGYEGDSREYAHSMQSIEDVYKIPLPKLTVGEWLSKRLIQVFGPGAFKIYTIGQIVDLDMYKPMPLWKWGYLRRGARQVKVLVSGLFDASVKAIPDALRAVSLLREKGFKVYLTRVSTVNTLDREGALADIDEYHCKISPEKMADVYRENDLLIAPSLSHEGFGLPFAEALACGLPAVATAIPSHLGLDRNHDYACFVPERDPVSMAEAASKIIKDRRLRNRLRRRGVEVVSGNFRSDLVAERLETVFLQALP